jgi:predicted phosphoribosyltransferase
LCASSACPGHQELAIGAIATGGVQVPSSYSALKREADEVIALMTPENFYAVGQWYENFSQTVTRLLASASHGPMRKEGAAV